MFGRWEKVGSAAAERMRPASLFVVAFSLLLILLFLAPPRRRRDAMYLRGHHRDGDHRSRELRGHRREHRAYT